MPVPEHRQPRRGSGPRRVSRSPRSGARGGRLREPVGDRTVTRGNFRARGVECGQRPYRRPGATVLRVFTSLAGFGGASAEPWLPGRLEEVRPVLGYGRTEGTCRRVILPVSKSHPEAWRQGVAGLLRACRAQGLQVLYELVDGQAGSGDQTTERAACNLPMVRDRQRCDVSFLGQDDVTTALSGYVPTEGAEHSHHLA